jgi:hypothetical protein
LIDVINAASAWSKKLLGNVPIKQESFAFNVDNEGFLWGDGGTYLKLPYRPILELTRLDPDVRQTGANWIWDGSSETGTMTYGTGSSGDWTLNMRTGEIHLLNGVFAKGPFVRVEGRAGYADGNYTADTGFPFGGEIFTAANDGGKYHRLFGWETAGESLRNAVDALVAHTYRQKDRIKDNVASRSGEGINITFFDNVPKEIVEAIRNAMPDDPVA